RPLPSGPDGLGDTWVAVCVLVGTRKTPPQGPPVGDRLGGHCGRPGWARPRCPTQLPGLRGSALVSTPVFIQIANISNAGSVVVSMRCPACHQHGTWEATTGADLIGNFGSEPVYLGQRRCPNPACRTHVFTVMGNDNKL